MAFKIHRSKNWNSETRGSDKYDNIEVGTHGNSYGLLGFGLANDVTIEFFADFLRLHIIDLCTTHEELNLMSERK